MDFADGAGGDQLVDNFDAITGGHVYLFRTPCQVLVDEGGVMPHDFNGDCRVNFEDFVSFGDEWLQ